MTTLAQHLDPTTAQKLQALALSTPPAQQDAPPQNHNTAPVSRSRRQHGSTTARARRAQRRVSTFPAQPLPAEAENPRNSPKPLFLAPNSSETPTN